LRFNRIAPADEGRYVCTASNMYGNTTKVAEVIVNSKLKKIFKLFTLKFTQKNIFKLIHQLMKLQVMDELKKHMKETLFLWNVLTTTHGADFQE
jgi:hypothetical protein